MTTEIALNETALQQVPAGDFMKKAFFENGRGISVIRHHGSYGNKQGLFEVAALKGTPDDFDLDMSVLEGDVLGWQTPSDVVAYARKIAELPATPKALENKGVHELK